MKTIRSNGDLQLWDIATATLISTTHFNIKVGVYSIQSITSQYHHYHYWFNVRLFPFLAVPYTLHIHPIPHPINYTPYTDHVHEV